MISGPNAGGKSVCLKTVGLLQYMLQCGMLIPLSPDSEAGIFEDLLLDMGDEQSLENDLSTYSSHLSNMHRFMQLGGKRSLFLIDEFGTGTEPRFGGAIAESILESLNKARMYGVVTTHYGNLKTFAEKTQGVVNGAMRFNMTALQPLYRLETGKPGSSFALEIAEKIGLPAELLDRARKYIGEKQVNLDRLIKELETEKTQFAEQNARLQTKEAKLTKTLSDYSELKLILDTQQKGALNQAKAQAKKLVQDANRLIEQTIRDIKENKAEKEPTKQLRQQLETFKETLEPEPIAPLPAEILAKLDDKPLSKALKAALAPPAPTQNTNPYSSPADNDSSGPIVPGNYVRVAANGAMGQVISMNGKDIEIRLGDLKSYVKLNRLEKISKREYMAHSSEEANLPRMAGVDLHERMTHFSFNLDLRGQRGEEAVSAVHAFMDDAVMLGAPELRIVHGKGDGILRQVVRNVLSGYKQVSTLKDEHPDRGGAGVTVIGMR